MKFGITLNAVSVLTFLSGAFLGIFNRWQHHSDNSFIIFGIFAAMFFLLSLLLYFFEYIKLARSITDFWIGLIFSVLTFTSVAYDHSFVSAQDLDIVDMVLIGSTLIHCFGILLERIHNYGNIEFQLLTVQEISLLTGFTLGIRVFEFGHQLTLTLLLGIAIAVACNLVAIHWKSWLSLINAFMSSILVTVGYLPMIKVQYNPFLLGCFAMWLSFEAIVDMYFSKYSTLEQCKGFLTAKLLFLIIFPGECTYFVCGSLLSKENHVDVGLAAICLWFAAHVVFFFDCWVIINKLEECSRKLKNRSGTKAKVLVSMGVRHISSMSNVLFTIATTLLLFLPLLHITDTWFLNIYLIIMPIECMVYSVLSSLGKHLGPTAVGYAVIVPSYFDSNYSLQDDSVFLHKWKTAVKLTRLISKFFNEHPIYEYETDYLCKSGVSDQTLESKLRSFLAERILNRVPYDSYVLYYSGPVDENGDWVLLDNKVFSFKQLLTIWDKVNGKTGSRLILVLDTKHSYKWLSKVKGLEKFVGMQIGKPKQDANVKTANVQSVGEVTQLWLNCNTPGNSLEELDEVAVSVDTNIQLEYGVSKNWDNFQFHVPTEEDITHYIEDNFPVIVQPLVKFFKRVTKITDLSRLYRKCAKSMRKIRLKLYAPLSIDTGHGFKLITEKDFNTDTLYLDIFF